MYSMYVKDQYIYDVTDSFIEYVISAVLVQVHEAEDVTGPIYSLSVRVSSQREVNRYPA
jgi:hypothetical protein